MPSEPLAIIRRTEGGIEVEPLEEEGATLIQEVKEQEGKKSVRIKSQAAKDCPLEPKVPAELTLCAALRDLRAARGGKMDIALLLKRIARREVLREAYNRDGLTPEVSEAMKELGK